MTTTYTADDRSHLFGAVRQYSICVKISQSTLVPLKSVKSLRTYTRQHCMHCKGCHCRRNRCPCCLLKLNTKWAKGHDEGRVSRDYSRTSSLRQRPLCPSRTQQQHHLKKVFFPKYAGQDFGLHLRCVMTEISKNSLKNSCLDLSYCAILESGVFAKSFMLKGHNLFLLGPF